MEDQLRVLITLGFSLLLIMLRLEAEKFGVAEYDEPTSDGRRTGAAMAARVVR